MFSKIGTRVVECVDDERRRSGACKTSRGKKRWKAVVCANGAAE